MSKILVLGCGALPRKPTAEWPEVVNLDMLALPGVDVVWDLNNFPWPFEDETFDSVEADNVLEHLDDVVRAMEETHRVLKLRRENNDPGLFACTVPLAGTYNHFTDVTHKRGFTGGSFDGFDARTEAYKTQRHYSWARFEVWRKSVLSILPDGKEMRVQYTAMVPAQLRTLPEAGGTDLRFELIKLPADEEVRALKVSSPFSMRRHCYGHSVYQT